MSVTAKIELFNVLNISMGFGSLKAKEKAAPFPAPMSTGGPFAQGMRPATQ